MCNKIKVNKCCNEPADSRRAIAARTKIFCSRIIVLQGYFSCNKINASIK